MRRFEEHRYLTRAAAEREVRLALHEGASTSELAPGPDADGCWVVRSEWTDDTGDGGEIVYKSVELSA
jgi:hypothetical protein